MIYIEEEISNDKSSPSSFILYVHLAHLFIYNYKYFITYPRYRRSPLNSESSLGPMHCKHGGNIWTMYLVRHLSRTLGEIMEPKTLIYDIETAPDIFWGWGTGKKVVHAGQIIRPGKIICISYRFMHWPLGRVKHLTWDFKKRENRFSYRWSDKKMVEKFYKIANTADVIVGHNGDAFDAKTINLRLAYYNIGSLDHLLSEDTLKQSRRSFRAPSHRLDFLCRYFNIPGKLSTSSDLWKEVALYDNRAKLKEMVTYCDNDVLILEELYKRVFPFVKHRLNRAVFTANPAACPHCGGFHNNKRGFKQKGLGKYQWYQCLDCGRYFTDGINLVRGKGSFNR